MSTVSANWPTAPCAPGLFPVPVPEGVVERNPQVQEAQAGYDAAHRTIGSIDGEGGVLQEKWILVPKELGPRRAADRNANVHAEHDAEK